jgi:hypothetical protein
MGTALGNAIGFLQDFGFFDVILPFLLVFTVTFGILEKIKIFGTVDGKPDSKPKTNINAMVAFSMSFFVITTKEIVQAIQISVPQVIFVLIAIICAMLLIGSMFTGKEEFGFKGGTVAWILGAILALAVLAIIFNSIGWLNPILDYVENYWDQEFITGIILLLVVIGAVLVVTGTNPFKKTSEEKAK